MKPAVTRPAISFSHRLSFAFLLCLFFFSLFLSARCSCLTRPSFKTVIVPRAPCIPPHVNVLDSHTHVEGLLTFCFVRNGRGRAWTDWSAI
ncbi:hypothetical protein BDY21DRAFT_343653 [Lineolata rhizophorae]|uniref:Uncharacterized protein n=1 Tax=Lineolata rhizophorae TaxID=578093 RepID=A0A6A6P039_9PEZI|nr:hypothetical protein BDY21DRAFT_343653 [Lineolata rhizophorae]